LALRFAAPGKLSRLGAKASGYLWNAQVVRTDKTLKLRVSDGKFIFVARTWSPVAAVDPFKSFCLFFPYRTMFSPKKFPPFEFSLSIYFFPPDGSFPLLPQFIKLRIVKIILSDNVPHAIASARRSQPSNPIGKSLMH